MDDSDIIPTAGTADCKHDEIITSETLPYSGEVTHEKGIETRKTVVERPVQIVTSADSDPVMPRNLHSGSICNTDSPSSGVGLEQNSSKLNDPEDKSDVFVNNTNSQNVAGHEVSHHITECIDDTNTMDKDNDDVSQETLYKSDLNSDCQDQTLQNATDTNITRNTANTATDQDNNKQGHSEDYRIKEQQDVCNEKCSDLPKQYQVEELAMKHSEVQHEEPPNKMLKVDSTTGEQECSRAIYSGQSSAKLNFQFDVAPRQLTGAWQCYSSSKCNNYLRGCKWAPDGTCLLTNSNDNCLRLFNLPDQLYLDGGENQIMAEMSPVLKMQESGTIYDYCWYPNMSSANPATACLAACSKDTPVHLFDAFSGEIRCSYRSYDQADELVAPHCISFDPAGDKLYCGFKQTVRVFDVACPGREYQSRPTFAKSGQRGIISCIAHSPSDSGLYAAGSYSKTIALYQEPKGEMICMFEGQQGGVTQIMFSPDGSKLYSGGRKDDEILCWDLRNPGRILYTLLRSVRTNQRVYFDITRDGRYVVSGSHNGTVLAWDISQPAVTSDLLSEPVLQPVMMYQAHTDAVNGLSLHPNLPVIATASGQRHFPMYDSDSENESDGQDNVDNSVRLWWLRETTGG